MTTQPPARPAAARAAQDQLIANFITQAKQLIETAQTDPQIAALLAPRGYPTDKLSEGLALQQTAQQAFNARQSALAAQKQATQALASASARQTFEDFRQTARAVFTSPADRAALAIAGRPPKDNQKFITLVRAAYNAAQAEPYAAALAAYGFPENTLAAALQELAAFETAGEAQNIAIGAAVQATAQRDAAVKNLKAWLKQFKAIAKVALRPTPALLTKLDL